MLPVTTTANPSMLSIKFIALINRTIQVTETAIFKIFPKSTPNKASKFINTSSAEIFNFLSDKKESNRKKSAEVVSAVLKDNITLFTSITNNLAKDKSINDK